MQPILPTITILALTTLVGCSRPQPNVVLVVVDTLRADHLGCYGYSRPTSPNIDALARRGTRFAAAHATTSWTAPSVVSMLTGLYPAVHGVEEANSVLGEDVPTMAEAFQGAGYATAAMVANPVFAGKRVGITRGFDSFAELHGPPAYGRARVKVIPLDPDFRAMVEVADAARVTDAALAWLGEPDRDSRPFFLFLHYIDPHADYLPPPEFAARLGVSPDDPLFGPAQRLILQTFRAPPAQDLATLVALYDAEIAYTDVHVGRLVADLDRRKRPTLFVFTADHGEEFGDHGGMIHGLTLYQEQLLVPLILAGPGVPRGVDVLTRVSLAGLWATMAEVASTAAPPSGTVASFAGLLRGSSAAPRAMFADLDNSERPEQHRRAIIAGDWKLIESRNGNRLLFDLGDDGSEQSDVTATAAARGKDLAAALAAYRDETAAPRARAAPATIVLSPEDKARMRALGYEP